MRYCSRCVLPDTRPNLVLDEEGVCNACRAHRTKPSIDWLARKAAFAEVGRNAKRKSRGYDCVIPVSGGKDSHWQVVTCLEYGLTPLAVTWKTPGRTELGVKNLENLVELGVDHIDYRINPRVERKLMYRCLAELGSAAIPMHMALFSIPLNVALRFGISLVVWGENSAFEYGSAKEEHMGWRMDAAWLRAYGATQGADPRSWLGGDISEKHLSAYYWPDADELEGSGLTAVFLGHFFPWDPQAALETAVARGFTPRTAGPKTGYYDYADIDDDFISIHHYLKWHKFGFTRLYDNLSLEIRNGRITRDQAIAIIRERGDETPHADIETLCRYLSISREHFFDLCERFRNPDIWKRRNGRWMIEDFLIEDWTWT